MGGGGGAGEHELMSRLTLGCTMKSVFLAAPAFAAYAGFLIWLVRNTLMDFFLVPATRLTVGDDSLSSFSLVAEDETS